MNNTGVNMDVPDWLRGLGFEEYVESFIKNEVDEEILSDLTIEDLKDLGVTKVGHRRKLLKAIAAMRPAPSGDKLADEPVANHEAEHRHLTVMFVDMVGSTELSVQLDPEDVRHVITQFQNTVTVIVGRFEGFVARFMGDGVLCYFGWPRANEDDAERAVRAGLSIIEGVKKVNTPDGSTLATRVGIASGLVIVGDLIGSGASEEAAVVGETPNLAARLQNLAGPDQLVLPKVTQELLSNVFTLKPTGTHSLKGIGKPVEAFVVTGERVRESRFAARSASNIAPLVGRDQELNLIRDGWTRAIDKFGQMILVSGEPGIGKSRIVQAAATSIIQCKHTRLTFQCSPFHSESAFYPIIHQMQYASGMSAIDSVDERLEKLERLAGVLSEDVPLLATMLSIDASERHAPLELTSAQLRARTMDVLVETLLRQASEQPVLVVFEDLHWVDPTTLEFLENAVDAINDQRILILATARPTFTHTFGGHQDFRRLVLNRLGRDQVFSIIDKVTNGKSLPDEVVQIIYERTDGVPLFIEELTKTILESDAIKDTGGVYKLNGSLNTLAIPNTLHDSLIARLDRLQSTKEVAQIASCIGREFPHPLLEKLSSLPKQSLIHALDELIEAELIYRRGVPPEARYQFKHALVRDAAYDSLLKPRRKAIHFSILEALQSDIATPAELLATHAEAAGLTERAIELWELASQRAVERLAFDEGMAHLQYAIQLTKSPEIENSISKEFSFQMQLGRVATQTLGYGSDQSYKAHLRARELAHQLENTELTVQATIGACMNLGAMGRNRESFELLVPLQSIELGSDIKLRCALSWITGAIYFALSEFSKSVEYQNRALGLSKRLDVYDSLLLGGAFAEVTILLWRSRVYLAQGRVDAALSDAEYCVAISKQHEHVPSLTWSQGELCLILISRGEIDVAQQHAENLLQKAYHFELKPRVAAGKIVLGICQVLQGEYSSGRVNIRDGINQWMMGGTRLMVSAYCSIAADALLRVDAVDEADYYLKLYEELQLEGADDRSRDSDLSFLRAQVLLSKGERKKAIDLLKSAYDLAVENGAWLFALRATTLWVSLEQKGMVLESAALTSLAKAVSSISEGANTVEVELARAKLAEFESSRSN